MAHESNVGGANTQCAHPRIARSARSRDVMVCLYCGQHLTQTEIDLRGSPPKQAGKDVG